MKEEPSKSAVVTKNKTKKESKDVSRMTRNKEESTSQLPKDASKHGSSMIKSPSGKSGKSTSLMKSSKYSKAPSFKDEFFISSTVEHPEHVKVLISGDKKEAVYDYLLDPDVEKDRHTIIPYKRMVLSNLFLMFLLVLLWVFWGYLYRGFHTYTDYVVPKGPLPNLHDICVAAGRETTGAQIDEDCVFQVDRYPQSCSTARCGSTYLVFTEPTTKNVTNPDELQPMKLFPHVKLSSYTAHINNDFLPCGESAWCYKGKCINVKDNRVAAYRVKSKVPIAGGLGMNCGRMKCILDDRNHPTNESIYLQKKDLAPCKNLINNEKYMSKKPCIVQYNDYTTSSVNYAFKSCTFPTPKFGGDSCWSRNEVPFEELFGFIRECSCVFDQNLVVTVWYATAQCTPIDGCRINCTDKSKFITFKANDLDCKMKSGEKGICFEGNCVKNWTTESSSCTSARK